jgi:protein-L-isoaspartate(D-aspartate) O-methyltransferase
MKDREQNSLAEAKLQLQQFWNDTSVIEDERLLQAFLNVRREDFVSATHRENAYMDYPLPIGLNQTISQPTTVMKMLSLLELEPSHRVLEVGAGSGYNAALLGQLCAEVVTLECRPELVDLARRNLAQAQLENVEVRHSDGKGGASDKAPFDRVIVTAAAGQFPSELWGQLREGGVLVVPIGDPYSCTMTRAEKLAEGERRVTRHGTYAFVPLV